MDDLERAGVQGWLDEIAREPWSPRHGSELLDRMIVAVQGRYVVESADAEMVLRVAEYRGLIERTVWRPTSSQAAFMGLQYPPNKINDEIKRFYAAQWYWQAKSKEDVMEFKARIHKGSCAAKDCKVKAPLFGAQHPSKGVVELCGAHYREATGQEPPVSAPTPEPTPAPEPVDATSAPTEVLDASTLAKREAEEGAAQAKSYLSLVAAYRIVDQESYNRLAEALKQIKGRAKALEERRDTVTKPLNAALKEVREWFRPALDDYEAIEREIKKLFVAYETQRQAAIAQARVQLDASATTEQVSTALTALKAAGEIEKPRGLSTTTAWKWRVTDFAAVPREFCSPDPAKIGTAVAATGGETRIPGIEVYQETSVRSTSA